MRFKIDWASLIFGSKFTVFALFYFVFEGHFPGTSPRGAYIWRGDLTEVFCVSGLGGGVYMEGLIFGILRYVVPRRSRIVTAKKCTKKSVIHVQNCCCGYQTYLLL